MSRGLIQEMDARIRRGLGTVRQAVRAALGQVDTAQPLTRTWAEGLNGESFADVELMQQYGFTSAPLAGADAVILPISGRSAHGVIVALDDSRHRVKSLAGGEVALYTDEGQTIILKRGKLIELSAQQVTLKTPLTVVEGNITTGGSGKSFTSTGTWTHNGNVTINGNLTLSGNLQVNGHITATGNIIDGGSNTNHHSH